MPDAPAGWYPDQDNAAQLRWWTGISWSDERRPVAPIAPPAYVPQPSYAPQYGYTQQPPAAIPPGSIPPGSTLPDFYAEPGFTMQTVQDQKGFFGNPYKLEGDLKKGRNRAAIWGLVIAILGIGGGWLFAGIGLYLGILGLLRSRLTDKGKNLSIVTISVAGFGIVVALLSGIIRSALGI